ncbi:MAG: sigma-54 dependent transcriptional regulator [Candidatus Aminicenantes bacterium]|nr:sigma-54 dependent transcriptional regulator [Candidatus Aminicenantes bacterium]
MNKIVILSSDEEFNQEIYSLLKDTSYEISILSLDKNIQNRIIELKPRIFIIKRETRISRTLDLIKKIKEIDPLFEVIVVGPKEGELMIAEFIRKGAADYLSLPLRKEDLLTNLIRIEEKISLRRETFQLEKSLLNKYLFAGMVSRNPKMLEIFSLIERFAKHEVTVLITGETGTGKELVAKALHKLSPRKDKPLLIVDCASLPETLFESEVFGYERGAFTGADRPKPGLLKEADGGTVFFDEISEIPSSAQAKLLRFLSEGTFKPLGSNKSIKVDLRVICATNRNLKDEVRKGKFREDLFHRINVAEINLPPLRKRKEDIPLLCLYFLDVYTQKYKKTVRGISNRAKTLLSEYDWPGNIRELEKVIERAVMLTTEDFIDLQHLPEHILLASPKNRAEEQPYPYSHLTLAEIEKKHLLEVLRAVNFNKKQAANLLGLTRPALYRKLKKHRLLT